MAPTKDRLQIDQADSGVPSWKTLLLTPAPIWTIAAQALDLLNTNKRCHIDPSSLVVCHRFLLSVVPILSLQAKHCQHCARDQAGCSGQEGMRKDESGVVDRVLAPLISSLCLRGNGSGAYISKPSSGGKGSSQTQSQKSSRPPRKRKRLSSDKTKKDPEEPPEGDGEPSGVGAPSKHPSDSGEPRGLKCPFYQRRPEAHQRTSCKVTTYESMPRLK